MYPQFLLLITGFCIITPFNQYIIHYYQQLFNLFLHIKNPRQRISCNNPQPSGRVLTQTHAYVRLMYTITAEPVGDLDVRVNSYTLRRSIFFCAASVNLLSFLMLLLRPYGQVTMCVLTQIFFI